MKNFFTVSIFLKKNIDKKKKKKLSTELDDTKACTLLTIPDRGEKIINKKKKTNKL